MSQIYTEQKIRENFLDIKPEIEKIEDPVEKKKKKFFEEVPSKSLCVKKKKKKKSPGAHEEYEKNEIIKEKKKKKKKSIECQKENEIERVASEYNASYKELIESSQTMESLHEENKKDENKMSFSKTVAISRILLDAIKKKEQEYEQEEEDMEDEEEIDREEGADEREEYIALEEKRNIEQREDNNPIRKEVSSLYTKRSSSIADFLRKKTGLSEDEYEINRDILLKSKKTAFSKEFLDSIKSNSKSPSNGNQSKKIFREKKHTPTPLPAPVKSFDSSSLIDEKLSSRKTKSFFMPVAVVIACVVIIGLLSNSFLFSPENKTRLLIIGNKGSDIFSMDISKTDKIKRYFTKCNIQGNAVLSKDKKYLYVTSKPDMLSCIDLRKNDVITEIKVAPEPESISFSPVQNYLAVICSKSNNISIVDSDYNNLVATIKSVGENPVKLCFSSNGKEIFVINRDSGIITVMDLTGKVLNDIKVDGIPSDILNTHISDRMYVTLRDKNEVIILDGQKKDILLKLSTGQEPACMTSHKEAALVAVICRRSQEIFIISVKEGIVIDTIKFQEIPVAMTFSDNGKELYIGTGNVEQSKNYIYRYDIKEKFLRKLTSIQINPVNLIFVSSQK